MLYDAIKKLVQYGINTGITPESERIYTTNLLLDLFHEDNYEDVDCDLNNLVLEDILAELLDIAAERGIIENSIGYRDLFDTKLMNHPDATPITDPTELSGKNIKFLRRQLLIITN